MRKNYHEIWVFKLGEKLFVNFADTDATWLSGLSARDYPKPGSGRVITNASRERLNRALMEQKPVMVYLHDDGPSVTYQIRRGTKLIPAEPARVLAMAA